MKHETTLNRLSPLRFVVAFGVVSMLADFVYQRKANLERRLALSARWARL